MKDKKQPMTDLALALAKKDEESAAAASKSIRCPHGK